LASGYLQLNKVNVVANKYIDSYEVTIFGSLASFAREINRNFLTDITTLTDLNHSASYYNITASWSGALFDGDILYPLIDYGEDYAYQSALEGRWGIDTDSGSLSVQDFKPAIRVKKVWDAIFEQFGYTYQSDFLTSSIFDNMYMVLHNGGKYPEYDGVNLENLGQIKIAPVSGSSSDNQQLIVDQWSTLIWENNEFDPTYAIGDNMSYYVGDRTTPLEGEIKLKFKVSGSAGVPQFQFGVFETGSFNQAGSGSYYTTLIPQWNNYLIQEYSVSSGQGDVEYDLTYFFKSATIPASKYLYFGLKYETFGNTNFTVTLTPNGDEKSYLRIIQTICSRRLESD
jgi:hypothetical protein